jgi:hypothetical protein
MPATIGAAAITAGAGLLGSLFGSHKQDKNETNRNETNRNETNQY